MKETIRIQNLEFRSLPEMEEWISLRNTEYRNGNSTVDDQLYDQVYFKYEELTGIRLYDGSVQYVKIDGNKKEKSPIPMAGLEKITSIEDFYSWIEKNNLFGVKLLSTPKYDGVSCGTISDGFSYNIKGYIQAYIKGEDNLSYPIWNHFQHVQSGKKETFDNLYHIGEIIMLNEIFERKYSNKFKNVRNFTAGKLNPNSQSTLELNDFVYMRYSIDSQYGEDCNGKFKTKEEIINYLNSINCINVPFHSFIINSNDNKEEVEKYFNDLYKQWNVEFTIDGIVVDVDSIELRKSLGRNTVGNPKYAIAYKGEFGDIKQVPIKKLNYTLDKDGVVNPSVTTDLVMLDGAECGKNIFVDNIKYLRDNHIYEGKRIEIKRGGKIIPRIYKPYISEEDNKKYSCYAEMVSKGVLPRFCPSCGHPLNYDDNKVDVRCTNHNCKERILRSTLFFFETIKSKGISIQTISKFISTNCYLESFLYDYRQLQLDYITAIIAAEPNDNLYSEIGKNQSVIIRDNLKSALSECPLSRLMAATNIFSGLGETKIGWFLDHYSIDYDDIEKNMFEKQWTHEDIEIISGYSTITASILLSGLELFKQFYNFNKDIILSIKQSSKPENKQVSSTGVDLSGQLFCFTGFRNPSMESIIIANGGAVKNSFTNKVTCLVVKEKGLGTVKEKKAIELGMKVMDEVEMRSFLKMNTIIEDQQKELSKKSDEGALW